ncbi:MAG TPA: MMPL family transporter [Planctomycetota bacterium]|nr:MMPL family transporter [Planctomycetota bacterium]
MPPADRRRLLQLAAWLLLFVPTTGWLLAGLLQQRVDPGNQALKTPDGADAQNLRALAEVVPSDPVLLLAFALRAPLPMLAPDRQRLDTLRTRIAAMPGVVACREPPSPDPGLVLMPVSMRGDDVAAIARAVLATARELAPPSLRVLATGLPLIEGAIAERVAGERTSIVPRLLLVLLLAAFGFYRQLGLACATLLPAIAAIAWTGGLIARLGHRLDPIAALLDPVLLTIGVAASVHFVEAYRRALASGRAPREAVAHAARELHTPALLATATTMVGLWSLATSTVPAVADFGIRAALGVALTHFFTFLVLPAWLPWAAPRAAAPPREHGHGAAWLALLRRHRTGLALATTAATVLAIAGLPRLAADNDPLHLLPRSDPVRADHDVLAARLGGVETFHLLVPARSPGSDPSRLLPFVAAVRQEAGVAGLAGPVQRGAGGELAVPMLLQPGGSAVRQPLFAAIDRGATVLGLDGLVPAGASVQIARDSHHLMSSLLGSLGLSFALLAAGMCLGLRSVRLGLCGMLPNLLPSAWIYGLLGWAAGPVSVATAMIACTMLGLIVDNTVHLLHHYRHARATRRRRPALRSALDRCGRAMTLSSVVLMLGFLVAATSQLETTIEFALLASTTIAIAWFGTAAVLPLLLLSRRPPDAAPAAGGVHAL